MSRRVRGQPAETTQLGLPFGIRSSPAKHEIEPLTVTVATAIHLTGLGQTKLYELMASGDLETVKIGRRTLVPMASLRALIERGRRR